MLLNITALTKTYTISGKLIIALNTVDLTFSENSFTCIVGKSGCGKTTLLRLLSGLEPATSGTIDYGKAAKIGFVFQEPRLMPWLTVNANIAFAAKNDPSLPAAPDEKLLELLGLKAFQHSFPAQLSGGMAQRTALGLSLIHIYYRQSHQIRIIKLFDGCKKRIHIHMHDPSLHKQPSQYSIKKYTAGTNKNRPITL